jgi:hypothetical protein
VTRCGTIAGTLCVVLSLSLSVLSAFVGPLAAIALLALAALAPLVWVLAPSEISPSAVSPSAVSPAYRSQRRRSSSVPRARPRLGVVRTAATTEDHAIIDLVLAPTPPSLLSAEHSAP